MSIACRDFLNRETLSYFVDKRIERPMFAQPWLQDLGVGAMEPDDIEKQLSSEPILIADVLRYANSASFGKRQEVASICDAVGVIGYSKLVRFISSRSLASLASRQLEMYGYSSKEFQRKSLACAFAMDYLGGQDIAVGSEFYTIGMLHAIGELVIDQVLGNFEDNCVTLTDVHANTLATLEKRLLGVNQAEAASIAMRSWGLPESVIQPIEWQFEPAKCPEYADTAFVLSTARYVSRLLIASDRGDQSQCESARHLTFQNKQLDQVLDRVRVDIAEFEIG